MSSVPLIIQIFIACLVPTLIIIGTTIMIIGILKTNYQLVLKVGLFDFILSVMTFTAQAFVINALNTKGIQSSAKVVHDVWWLVTITGILAIINIVAFIFSYRKLNKQINNTNSTNEVNNHRLKSVACR